MRSLPTCLTRDGGLAASSSGWPCRDPGMISEREIIVPSLQTAYGQLKRVAAITDHVPGQRGQ